MFVAVEKEQRAFVWSNCFSRCLYFFSRRTYRTEVGHTAHHRLETLTFQYAGEVHTLGDEGIASNNTTGVGGGEEEG